MIRGQLNIQRCPVKTCDAAWLEEHMEGYALAISAFWSRDISRGHQLFICSACMNAALELAYRQKARGLQLQGLLAWADGEYGARKDQPYPEAPFSEETWDG